MKKAQVGIKKLLKVEEVEDLDQSTERMLPRYGKLSELF